MPLALLLILVSITSSCTRAMPEILAVSTRIVRTDASLDAEYAQKESAASGTGINEYLSFFCMVRDEDGIIDLEELWLVNDSEELYWHLDSSQWLWIEHSGENWLGSHELRMPNGAPFPAGSWRVLLSDKAGERAERSFILKIPSSWPEAPNLLIEGDTYTLQSSWARHQLIAYDEGGGRVKVQEVEEKSGRVRNLKLPETTRTIALWAEDIDGIGGILTPSVPYTR